MRSRTRTTPVSLPDLPASTWIETCSPSTPIFDLRISPTPHILHSTTFAGLSSLSSRLHELPPSSARTKIPGVISDDPSAAAAVLHAAGYACLAHIRLDDLPPSMLLSSTQPSRALWQPSAALVALLPSVTSRTRTAVDIGAGSGRDAAFLAGRGWSVTAVDRDVGLVEKAVALGSRRDQGGGVLGAGVGGGVVRGVERTFGRDLGDDRGVLEIVGEGVEVGGFVVIEHFLTGCEAFGGPVKKAQMLERGELGRVFGSRGFEVLVEEERGLPDGRPVVWFLARKVE